MKLSKKLPDELMKLIIASKITNTGIFFKKLVDSLSEIILYLFYLIVCGAEA